MIARRTSARSSSRPGTRSNQRPSSGADGSPPSLRRERKNDQALSAQARDDRPVATTLRRDRLRALIDSILESLDVPARGDELAARVHLSRFHFDRLVAGAIGESPGEFRRRLLLERAAYELGRGAAVLETALGAGYSAQKLSRARFGGPTASRPADSAGTSVSRLRTAFISTRPAGC